VPTPSATADRRLATTTSDSTSATPSTLSSLAVADGKRELVDVGLEALELKDAIPPGRQQWTVRRRRR
jgi:hypothetical protein